MAAKVKEFAPVEGAAEFPAAPNENAGAAAGAAVPAPKENAAPVEGVAPNAELDAPAQKAEGAAAAEFAPNANTEEEDVAPVFVLPNAAVPVCGVYIQS